MAKSPTQQIAELRENHAVLREGFDTLLRSVKELQDERKAEVAERSENARLRQELAETRKQLEEERVAARARDEKIAELYTKDAAQHTLGDQHAKQIEQLNTRVWGLIALLLVAALSFIGYSLRK